jgi:hypothetical protein
MYIHNFLKNGNNYNEEARQKGIIQILLSYFWTGPGDSFFYNIGGYNFTLEELKHGVLRANNKPNGSFFKIMSDNDERAQLLDKLSDPKVLFLCLDRGQIPEAIECFDDPDTLDEKFDYFLTAYFKEKIEIDSMNEEITLPTVFDTYKGDFGGTDEKVLKFIWNWYQNSEYDLDDIIKLVSKKSLMIKYDDQIGM